MLGKSETILEKLLFRRTGRDDECPRSHDMYHCQRQARPDQLRYAAADEYLVQGAFHGLEHAFLLDSSARNTAAFQIVAQGWSAGVFALDREDDGAKPGQRAGQGDGVACAIAQRRSRFPARYLRQ